MTRRPWSASCDPRRRRILSATVTAPLVRVHSGLPANEAHRSRRDAFHALASWCAREERGEAVVADHHRLPQMMRTGSGKGCVLAAPEVVVEGRRADVG